MDGFRSQNLSDDTSKLPSNTNRSIANSTTSLATYMYSSSVLHLNPNCTSQNPIHPFSHSIKFQPSNPPSAGPRPTSLLGVSSSGFPLPATSFPSSCHYSPSASKGRLKEERSSSSISSTSASDSDYVGNDDMLQFKEETTAGTEDESRKRIRRERNKQAAARCRQRRVDLTNQLMAETETLDTARADLQRQVENLVRQKSQLEFILQAHKTQCRMVPPSNPFDFGFDNLLEAQVGPNRLTGVPSSTSSTSVIHNYSDGISPTLLNL